MIGRDKTKKDTYMLETLIKMFRRKQINQNHPLQRKADQWGSEAKSGLVGTVIKEEDMDSIKICEQILSPTKFVLWLIDGLQRLTVLEEYRNNVFKIGKTLEMPFVYYQKENEDGEMEVIEYDLRGKFFSDLPEELQDIFDSYNIDVVKHLDCTDEEVAYHIGRYNRQTSMNTNQKNILPMYKVAAFVKEISNGHVFFKNCGEYTQPEKKKGVIDRVVCESIMTMFHLDEWKKGKTMSKYLNENATKEEFDIFEKELDRLSKFVDKKTTGQLFNSKNSFIWFAVFHRFTKLGLDDLEFKDFLIEFQNNLHNKTFEEFENESFDTYDNNRSTKDKKVVYAKIDMLEKLMKDFLHIEDEEVIEDETEKTTEEGENNEVEQDNDVLTFCKETVSPGIDSEDVELYSDMIDDCVRIDSPVYINCKNALIGLMGFAVRENKDEEFEDWIKDYQNGKSNFSPSQKINFAYMKNDFNKYLLQKGMAING